MGIMFSHWGENELRNIKVSQLKVENPDGYVYTGNVAKKDQ